MHRRYLAFALLTLLAACTTKPKTEASTIQQISKVEDPYLAKLANIPTPVKPINVAVYSFTDQSGQRRASDVYADLSNAVSQGGNDILIAILLRTGQGNWFNVVERDELKAVVQEREIGKQVTGRNSPKLASADYILTGGIIGYDSNYVTGGAGARYFGIGGDVEYRSDLITVALRLVEVKTGRVLSAVEAHDTVMSYGAQGQATHYFGSRLFEAEAGFTQNDVTTLSARRAIAKALLELIQTTVDDGDWRMNDDFSNQLLAYLDVGTNYPMAY